MKVLGSTGNFVGEFRKAVNTVREEIRPQKRNATDHKMAAKTAPFAYFSSTVYYRFLFTTIFATSISATVARERNTGVARFASEDPNSRFVCEGPLAEYAACQCKEDEGEVACINAQFVDASIFMTITTFYKYLNRVTFHGNNFQDLPSGSLFGSSNVYSNLIYLNISANYIVNLNSNALEGLSNLKVLDLSNNEIVLKEADLGFLSHTPRLTELYLRRAFTSTINRTVQFDYMMRVFRRGVVEKLQVLDLSYNYFSSLPFDLTCPFPSLTRLDLRQNFLKTFVLNETCLFGLRSIDLSRNQMHSLDPSFRSLANSLPPNTFLLKNAFQCDCNSKEYIQWIRTTNVVREKGFLLCDRASPRALSGSPLLEVLLDKLDCSVDLSAVSSASQAALLRSLPLISLLLWPNSPSLP